MTLHIEQAGKGPALVMLHGWGANSGIWASIAGELAEHFRLHMIDLPGHGHSDFDAHVMKDITALADEVVGQVEKPAHWLGWSLGGMVALAIAQRYPDKVKSLLTVASAPRFLKAHDWPDAVDASVLGEFSRQVQKDPRTAITRFVALQTRGSETQRNDSRILKASLLGEGMASVEALEAGLNLLGESDLRAGMQKMTCTRLVIAGERDSLHPLASMKAYADLLPAADLRVIKKAGHAPFISHKQEFVTAALEFFQRHETGLSQSA